MHICCCSPQTNANAACNTETMYTDDWPHMHEIAHMHTSGSYYRAHYSHHRSINCLMAYDLLVIATPVICNYAPCVLHL